MNAKVFNMEAQNVQMCFLGRCEQTEKLMVSKLTFFHNIAVFLLNSLLLFEIRFVLVNISKTKKYKLKTDMNIYTLATTQNVNIDRFI